MDPSRPLNPNIRLVRSVSEEVFDVLLIDLKHQRKGTGTKGWGKLEAAVLHVTKLVTLGLFNVWVTPIGRLEGFSCNVAEFIKGGRYWGIRAEQNMFSEGVFLSIIINSMVITLRIENYTYSRDTLHRLPEGTRTEDFNKIEPF